MLQDYREQEKVAQQEIADATGLAKNYISSIERGVHSIRQEMRSGLNKRGTVVPLFVIKKGRKTND